jgi:hypothetical protein
MLGGMLLPIMSLGNTISRVSAFILAPFFGGHIVATKKLLGTAKRVRMRIHIFEVLSGVVVTVLRSDQSDSPAVSIDLQFSAVLGWSLISSLSITN